MVGRAAQGDPFVFRRILRALNQRTDTAALQTGAQNSCVETGASSLLTDSRSSDGTDECSVDIAADEEIHTVLQRHLRGIYELYGEYRGVRIARKHISWYLKSKHGAAAYRQRANQAESAVEQMAIVDQFFNMDDQARKEQNLLH